MQSTTSTQQMPMRRTRWKPPGQSLPHHKHGCGSHGQSLIRQCLVLLLTSLFLLEGVNMQATPLIRQAQVSLMTATTIGSTTDISILLQAPMNNNFISGDKVQISFFTRGSFIVPTGTPNCRIQGSSSFTVSVCTITATQATVTLGGTGASSQFLTLIIPGFKIPSSNTRIADMGVTMFNTLNNQKGAFTGGIVDGFTADVMLAASIKPLSPFIGQKQANIEVSFKPKNPLKSNGKVFMYFEYWNPNAASPEGQLAEDLTITCSNVQNMNPSMSCTYNKYSQLLIITNPVLSDQSNVDLIFRINNFKNPFSAKPRSGYYLYTTDNVDGQIDSTRNVIAMSLTVTQPADFRSVEIQRNDNIRTVGQLSSGIMTFDIGLPMEKGCKVVVTFPTDMPVTGDLTNIVATGITASTTVVKDLAANTVTLTGCDTYLTDSQTSFTLFLNQIKNKPYVQATESFSITIYNKDASGEYIIAQRKSNIILTASQFQEAKVASLAIDADTKEIQKQTRYKITIKPQNSMATSSRITVVFPSTIKLDSTCKIDSATTPMVAASATCSISGQTITVDTPFGTSGKYTEGEAAFSFIFSTGGTNPDSAKNAGVFTASTFRVIGTPPQAYLQDQNVFDNIYVPDPSSLTASVSLVSPSYETYYSPSTFTLSITPLKRIPIGGIISIEFPPEVTLIGFSVGNCIVTIAGQARTIDSIQTLQTAPTIIKITGAFPTGYSTPGTPFTVACGGFRNPRTTATTSSFKVYTYDASESALERGITGITAKMLTTPDMNEFSVVNANIKNGAIDSYTVQFRSKIPHSTGDIISFKFPPEIILQSNTGCVALGVPSAVACTKVGSDVIQAKLTFSTTDISASTSVTFLVTNVKNPPDTRPSSSFTQIKITDSTNILQLTQFTGTVAAATSEFADIVTKSLSQTVQTINQPSDYTITFKNINQMPSTAAFRIKYPSTVVVNAASVTTCTIDYLGTKGLLVYKMSCTVDAVNSYILLNSGLLLAIPADATLKLSVGPITNPRTQANPGTFELYSFVDSNYNFRIDQIKTGLVPTFDCDYPCKTCFGSTGSQRAQCLSCQTDLSSELNQYLYQQQCLTACPEGFYADINKVCNTCPIMCKTCKLSTTDLTKVVCTSCFPDSSLPYLEGDVCVGTCSADLCPINFMCQTCNSVEFKTLTGTPSPQTVNSQNSFVRFTIELDTTLTTAVFEDGDIINLVVPSPGFFNPTTSPSACASYTPGISIVSCAVYSSQVQLKLQLGPNGPSQVDIQIGNFNNPPTTKDIDGVSGFLIASSGLAKSITKKGIITGFQPAYMVQASAVSSSPKVGDSDQTLTVSFTTINTFKTTYNLKMVTPRWNPSSSSPTWMFKSETLTCTALTGFPAGPLNCAFVFGEFVISSPAASTDIPGGTTVSFTISGFQNPYNGVPKSGFVATTLDTVTGGRVDETVPMSVTCTEFAALSSPTLKRDAADPFSSNQVSYFSQYISGFKLNLPVDANCVFRIYFTDNQKVDLNLYQSTGTNLFSTVANTHVLNAASNYLDIPGCPSFSEPSKANLASTVSYGYLVNMGWIADSSPFIYEFYASVQGILYKIARSADPSLIIPASEWAENIIQYFGIESVDSSDSSSFTRYKLKIWPSSSILPGSKIIIKFPKPTDGNGIQLNDRIDGQNCILTEGDGGIPFTDDSTTCVPDAATNSITLTNVFDEVTYVPGNVGMFSFIFSTGGTNPIKACSAGSFEVSTYRVIGTTGYIIDYKKFTDADPDSVFGKFIPDASALTASLADISKVESSAIDVSYKFSITPKKDIPANSWVKFTLPATVGVSQTKNTITCRTNLSPTTSGSVTVSTSVKPIVFSMTTLFPSTYTLKTTFEITCDNFQNPRTLLPSDSFRIDVSDNTGCAIETAKTGIVVQASKVQQFKSVTVTADSKINGVTTAYTFNVEASINFIDGDILYLTFPPETSLSTIACGSTGLNLKSAPLCSSSQPNEIKVQLYFTSSLGAQKFSFSVNNIKNSASTKTTSAFTNIRATDKDGNEIQRLDTTGPTVTNTQPAIITGQLDQDDESTSAQTPYTITYVTKNKMSADPSFKIEYPDILTVPTSLSTCQATYGPTLAMSCAVNTAQRTIIISKGASGGLPGPIPEGSTIKIKIAPITNPRIQYRPVASTPSLRLTSFFSESGLDYLYDQVSSGLQPEFKCIFPCATCTGQKSAVCTSCYTSESSVSEKYLYGTSCLAQCPDGFYSDNFVCKACPAECKTCSDAKTCTSCKTEATSQFRYLNGTWCYNKCPDTFFGDSSFLCRKCDSNCKTCNNSATNCISCEQNSNFPLLSKTQCVSRCDSGFTSINFQCQQCKAPCATCVTSLTTCQSCLTGFLLGTECRSSCPPGYTTDNKKCIGCDPRCEKCSPTDATRCLQCQSPLILLNNTCISKCPDGYKTDDQKIVCQQIQYKPGGVGGGGNGFGNGSYMSGDDLWESKTPNASVYFVTQIAQTVAGGAGVGRFFKDKIGSPWTTNVIGLWAPIEMATFGSQAYLSYDQLAKLEMKNLTGQSTNGTNSASNSTSSLKGRILVEIDKALTSDIDGIIPLVFYGTAFALVVNILCNFLFAAFFLMIMRRDSGYQEWVVSHKCHPYSLLFFGTIFSFKMHKFFYTTFWGNYQIPFEKPERIRKFFNILTTLNLIFVLTPVILIDVYGLSKYKWGSQFYVMMIETLIFALSMIVLQIIELRRPKTDNYDNAYAGLDDMSDKIDEEVKRRLAQALEDYARRLKADRDGDKNNLRRTKSETDLGDREKEEDPRRVNTDPLDHKKKKMYDDRLNPYHQVLDHDYPDNCYAEVGRNLKAPEDPQVKVQQTGQRVLSGDEYDRDYEARMRMLNMANMRNDQRQYGVNQGEDEETPLPYKKRKNMRGRKGKYYSQVDDEDQTFLEQERRLIDGKIDEYDDEDDEESKLAAIEEESLGSTRKDDDKTKLLANNKGGKQVAAKPSPKGSAVTSPRDQKASEKKDPLSPPKDKAGKGKVGAIPEAAEEHEDELIPKKKTAVGPNSKGGVKQSQDNLKKSQQSLAGSGKNQDVRKSKVNIVKEEDKNASDDDILDQNEVVMNKRLKQQPGGPKGSNEFDVAAGAADGGATDGDVRQSYSRLKSTEDIRKEIEKMGKKLEQEQKEAIQEQEKESDPTSQSDGEKGQPDSDSEEDKRLANMRDPEKRRFNVNDILGDFDRDERGHPLILQDKKGELIDKGGKRVNEKGYLVDPKTGDILEKEKGRKIFSSDELDERGELPPPFNLERYNFNGHDVRGYFDRDPKTGEEIMKNLKRDKQGFLIDKLGRRVNEHGYLIDMYQNLVDKRLRTKLHKHIMEQNGGEIPQLFTYKGKKFDLPDVMGHLDKDRKGNIIIRRNNKGEMVDKKGRRVNQKGYLVDADGNVINKDGKVMFENYTLNKDGEIPKLFPFLKFNIDEVKGDYEMDPLGNPMLQKTREGYLVDSKGRRVNAKGYLIDQNGNVVNKRGNVVFNKRLLEDDGEIPKVFRAGLLRKDTFDSFSQLMSEIEDLERLQEMGENGGQADPRMQEKMRRRMEKENARMQKKIDKIVDGDEDEGMLMKELEELAKGGPGGAGGEGPGGDQRNATARLSDGGNTSVDSMMEDTPSNYNALNQRFMEVENIKNKAKRNMGRQSQVQEGNEEDEEVSEYSYMPDRKMRKKKKKKKKKKRADGTIDERELMMAKAYGGLSQNQYDKLVALRRQQQSQLPGPARIDTAHSMMQRTPSNMQSALQAQRFSRVGGGANDTLSRFNEDQRSEWGESQNPEGGRIVYTNQARPPVAGQPMSRQKNMGNSTSRIVVANKPAFRSNNLMGSTQRSHADGSEENTMDNIVGPNFGNQIPSQNHIRHAKSKGLIDGQQLANVANSVSGFYKDQGASDQHSQMSRTQDNFASNVHNNRRSGLAGPGDITGINQGSPRDENFQRIYGTAKGSNANGRGGNMIMGPNGMPILGDDLSDGEGWERGSNRSGRSQMSHFSQVNQLKVKGLETIYLQRLEPAAKGTRKKQDKAKFRVMHHKYHDEPEWHVEDRDELDSIISGNYKEMQKKFEEEFQGSSNGTRSKKTKPGPSSRGDGNIFSGNLRQYKEIGK